MMMMVMKFAKYRSLINCCCWLKKKKKVTVDGCWLSNLNFGSFLLNALKYSGS